MVGMLRIWLADLLAGHKGFRNVLGSIGELLCMCCRGGETCLERASNTDNASVRKTGSKESLTIITACLGASVSAL